MAAKRKAQPVDESLPVENGPGEIEAAAELGIFDAPDFIERVTRQPLTAETSREDGRVCLSLPNAFARDVKAASGELVNYSHGLKVIGSATAAEALVYDAERVLWRVVGDGSGVVFVKV